MSGKNIKNVRRNIPQAYQKGALVFDITSRKLCNNR